MSVTTAFIGGQETDTRRHYDNIDPATGASLGAVVTCGPQEVDSAVAAARAAQPGWAAKPVAERAAAVSALSRAILDSATELAIAESEDTGKPLTQARADAAVTARYFEYYSQLIAGYHGDTIPLNQDFLAYTDNVPYGVTAHIVAWNYPMQLLARGVAPALVAGNCVVAKPADETPRTTVMIARIAKRVGIPDGVFNVVPGIGAETGALLTAHPGIDHVGFVGSTAIGREVAKAASQNIKPVTLELGGKSAHVVCRDADLDAAAAAITMGIIQNAGQTCSAGSRVIVHQDRHDELVARLAERFASIRIGRGLDDPDLGPLVSAKQQRRVLGFFDDVDGTVVCGGAIPADAPGAGAWFSPSIVDGVDPHSRIAQEEVFGPVLAVMTFRDLAEAVRLANATPYALMGAVWSAGLSDALRLAEGIRAGQVYVNAFGAGGGVELPFGGFGESGYGREKGIEGLRAYTQTKTYVVRK